MSMLLNFKKITKVFRNLSHLYNLFIKQINHSYFLDAYGYGKTDQYSGHAGYY